MTTNLAVLGSPIGHSKSPLLHAAAYRELGLDWNYSALEVTGEILADFVRSRDDSWRGLSLTMPLKRDVIPILDELDSIGTLTGAANTVLITDGRLSGFNTDVYGIVRAFSDAGVDHLDNVQILGGGATAASAIVAMRELGARRITVSVRSVARAADLVALGRAGGVDIVVSELGPDDQTTDVPDAVISTLPGHAEHAVTFSSALRESAVLFDVAYDPWPSTLAEAWTDAGGTVISGLEMLINQAVAQVRIFVNADAAVPLDREADVLAAMRAAVGA